jgi:3-oxoisoapionate kinase
MSLLLAFYGDDFTGSTDAMEVLQWAGLRTVLFLEPPSPAQLARFEGLRAFGVAGLSRTMTPREMDHELAPALAALQQSGAPLVHYKICSTFDSAPQVGSIGRTLEIGRRVVSDATVPIVVGAPVLGRFTVFGNLFARSGLDTEPYRLDRHPTMQRHPVTPMTEADLRRHLAAQTELEVALFDVLRLDGSPDEHWDALLATAPPAVLIDVLYPSHLPVVGRLLDRLRVAAEQRFVVGSSGVEYALVAHWEQAGLIGAMRSHAARLPTFEGVDRLVVVSGSCSPVSERQMAWAEQHGFEPVPLDVTRLVRPDTRDAEVVASVDRALDVLARGASPILHTSRGPDDPRVVEVRRALEALGVAADDVTRQSAGVIGPVLGRIVHDVAVRARVTRLVVAGGDTSSHVARALGVDALEAVAAAAPGSPLCRMHTSTALDGTEVVFKGGQVGHTGIYGLFRKGTAAA